MNAKRIWNPTPPWRLLASALLAAPLLVYAADHDEADDGDLADDPANPTAIAVDVGDNIVRGLVTDNPLDRDIFTMQVPADTVITEVRLSDFLLLTQPSDGGMLVALEEGSQITDLNSSAALRGFVIAGVAFGTEEGDDLLDDLGGGALGEGDWTFWIQNTGSITEYELTFVAEAVQAPPPPPPTQRPAQPVPTIGPLGWLFLLSGILLLARGALRRL